MTRAENVKEAQRLRGQGLRNIDIAERMGTARGTVGAWLADPDLSKQRARRKLYSGACADCGGPTDGSNGIPGRPRRCNRCASQHRELVWPRERIIAAIRDFADQYGRPPAAADWNPAQARAMGHHERAEAFYRDGCWPYMNTVRKCFGTWNAAIAAAGFVPRESRWPR